MRTVLAVDHKKRVIQDVKIQRFNRESNLLQVTKEEEQKLMNSNGCRFGQYKRIYEVLK